MSETVRASNRLLYRLRVVVELLPRAFSFLPTAQLPREVRHQREAPAHTLPRPGGAGLPRPGRRLAAALREQVHPYGPGCRWQGFRTSGPFSITPPRTHPLVSPAAPLGLGRGTQSHRLAELGHHGLPWVREEPAKVPHGPASGAARRADSAVKSSLSRSLCRELRYEESPLNRIQQHGKRIMHRDRTGFIPGSTSKYQLM